MIVLIRFDRHFNLFDEPVDLGMICIISSFVFIVVSTVTFAVTNLITLDLLSVNATATRIAPVLRAVFIGFFRLIAPLFC